ncbi:MAG: hypothetical protein D6768_18650, partial [Chloroflexi bacterium]
VSTGFLRFSLGFESQATPGRTVAKCQPVLNHPVIDTPIANEKVRGKVHVSGWAISQLDPKEGVEQITLYLDSLDDPAAELGQAERGILRGDQIPHFGHDYAHCGYQFSWDAGQVGPGQHTLYVLVEGKGGWHYSSRQIVVK